MSVFRAAVRSVGFVTFVRASGASDAGRITSGRRGSPLQVFEIGLDAEKVSEISARAIF
jgi:hypothetical protein